MDPSLDDFVTEHWVALVRYAAVVAGDTTEGKSAVRAALTKPVTRSRMLRNRHDLNDPDRLDAYVRTAVVRALIRRWRRQQIALDDSPAPEIGLYDAAASLDQPATPMGALRQMPPRQRAMLALRFLTDRSEAETAAVLGCSESAVRTQTLGALAILRRRFPDLADPLLDSDHAAGVTGIRDLLEAAGSEAVPDPGRPPLNRIRRTARLRQALTGTGAGLAAAAVALLVSLPFRAPGVRSQPARPGVGPHVVMPVDRSGVGAVDTAPGASRLWQRTMDGFGEATGVAVGFGSAWDGGRGILERRNPVTGRIENRILQPAPVVGVTVGAGRVWSLTTPRDNAVRLLAYDPATGRTTTAAVPGLAPVSFDGSASYAGSLWLPSPSGRLLRATPGRNLIAVTTDRVSGGPQSLAVAGRDLWLQRAQRGELTRIVPGRRGRGFRLGQTVTWSGRLLAAASDQADPNGYPLFIPFGVWTTDGTRLVGLTPGALRQGRAAAEDYVYRTNATPRQVVTSRRGVYVADDAGVDFFSNDTLRSGYQPTAQFRRPTLGWVVNSPDQAHLGVSAIAADGSGVLILDGDGTITYWRPPTQHGH